MPKEIILEIGSVMGTGCQTIVATVNDDGSGAVTSTLRNLSGDIGFSDKLDGLEAMVSAHACIGVDVKSAQYVRGLCRAVNDFAGRSVVSTAPEGSRPPDPVTGKLFQENVKVSYIKLGGDNSLRIQRNASDNSASAVLCGSFADKFRTVDDTPGTPAVSRPSPHDPTGKYGRMVYGIESVACYHVVEGLKVKDPAYIDGVKMAIGFVIELMRG